MSLSINTNVGALTALSVLNQTNKSLETTQARISSGFRVATAKDDAASYSIASKMRSDVAGFEAVKIGLGIGEATVGTAIKAAEAIKELLVEMKAKAVQAQGGGLTDDDRHALNDDVNKLQDQIDNIVRTAEFNDKNLIKKDGDSMSVVADVSGTSQIEITAIALDQVTLGLMLDPDDYKDDASRRVEHVNSKDDVKTDDDKKKYSYDDSTNLTVSGEVSESSAKAVVEKTEAARSKAQELAAAVKLIYDGSVGSAKSLETALTTFNNENDILSSAADTGSAAKAEAAMGTAIGTLKTYVTADVNDGNFDGGGFTAAVEDIQAAVGLAAVAKDDADAAFTKAEEMVTAAKLVWDHAIAAATKASETATAVEAAGGSTVDAVDAREEADQAVKQAEHMYDFAVVIKDASLAAKTAVYSAYDAAATFKDEVDAALALNAGSGTSSPRENALVLAINKIQTGDVGVDSALTSSGAITTGKAASEAVDEAEKVFAAYDLSRNTDVGTEGQGTLVAQVTAFLSTNDHDDDGGGSDGNVLGNAADLRTATTKVATAADTSATNATSVVTALADTTEAIATALTSAGESNTSAATASTDMEAAKVAAVAAYDLLNSDDATNVSDLDSATTVAIDAAVEKAETALASAVTAETNTKTASDEAEAAKTKAKAALDAATGQLSEADAQAAYDAATAAATEAAAAYTKAGLAKAAATTLKTKAEETKTFVATGTNTRTNAIIEADDARQSAFTAAGHSTDTAGSATKTVTLLETTKTKVDAAAGVVTSNDSDSDSDASDDDTRVIQVADRITMIDITEGDKTSVNDVKKSQELIDEAIDTVTEALAYFGSVSKQLEIQKDFTQGLIDQLNIGIGTLVDADMAQESAMLQSLQIKQNLGTQALGIANAAPQTILGLFG